jgi:hypothetical protein
LSSAQSVGLTYVDFFTTTHRISAGLQPGSKPLSDLLNDRSQSYMLVSNVYVSRLDKPGEIRAHAPVAYLAKDHLLLAIVPLREARVVETGRYTAQEYAALVTLPGFEVKGRFFGPRRLDLRSFSPVTLEPFVALTEATAQSVGVPGVEYNGDVILVNRARLESLCLTEWTE